MRRVLKREGREERKGYRAGDVTKRRGMVLEHIDEVNVRISIVPVERDLGR